MRKRLIDEVKPATSLESGNWLNLENLVEVEISSEDAAHPIESALTPGAESGWRAAVSGKQTIRLVFNQPQRLRKILLSFVERSISRTQEYVLRWSADGGQSFHEIVRQQWNFNPQGANTETEEHQVELSGVNVLELIITPEIGGGDAVASLAHLRVA